MRLEAYFGIRRYRTDDATLGALKSAKKRLVNRRIFSDEWLGIEANEHPFTWHRLRPVSGEGDLIK